MAIINKDKDGNNVVTHEGHVLTSEWRSAGFGDEDRYALVYREEGDDIQFDWIMIDTTRFAPSNTIAEVDAPEVIKALWKQRQLEAQQRATARFEDARDHRPDQKGKFVFVTGGKKHKGKSGRITWIGPNKYARRVYGVFADKYNPNVYSLRVQTPDGEGFFVTGDQVAVIVEPIEGVNL